MFLYVWIQNIKGVDWRSKPFQSHQNHHTSHFSIKKNTRYNNTTTVFSFSCCIVGSVGCICLSLFHWISHLIFYILSTKQCLRTDLISERKPNDRIFYIFYKLIPDCGKISIDTVRLVLMYCYCQHAKLCCEWLNDDLRSQYLKLICMRGKIRGSILRYEWIITRNTLLLLNRFIFLAFSDFDSQFFPSSFILWIHFFVVENLHSFSWCNINNRPTHYKVLCVSLSAFTTIKWKVKKSLHILRTIDFSEYIFEIVNDKILVQTIILIQHDCFFLSFYMKEFARIRLTIAITLSSFR